MSEHLPSERELDALREVANVGCGHAASALSQLVGGRKVDLSVPRVIASHTAQVPELVGGLDASVLAAHLGMTGEMTGRMVLTLPDADARHLCRLLLPHPSDKLLEEPQKSALAEVANIVASACLSAIGRLTGLKLLPSVPTLTHEPVSLVLDELLEGEAGETAVVLEARFFTPAAPPVSGQLLVVPDTRSLKVLLQRLGV